MTHSYIYRQLDLLESYIAEYEDNKINLMNFVRQLNGLTSAINLDSWSDDVYRVRVALEEVYAVALDEKRELDEYDIKIISKNISELKTLIKKHKKR